MNLAKWLRGTRRRAASVYGKQTEFRSSQTYWENRYATGGTSGRGSYDELARFKAEVLNAFIAEHEVRSVVEFGCGDGAQLALLEAGDYIGLDVSATVLADCIEKFRDDATKSFYLYDGTAFADRRRRIRADLAVSLDVVYHLVEDDVYDRYMTHLFDSSERFVIVYSSNEDAVAKAPHVRHRRFTDWVESRAPSWRLRQHIPNRYPAADQPAGSGSFADFYVFGADAASSSAAA